MMNLKGKNRLLIKLKNKLHLILFDYYKCCFNIIIQFKFQILKDTKIINSLLYIVTFFLRYEIRKNKKKYERNKILKK